MASGLEDVIAAETILSDVDGAQGRLIVRGVLLDDLVVGTRFEDVLALLLDGFFPVEDLQARLGSARQEVFDAVPPSADLS